MIALHLPPPVTQSLPSVFQPKFSVPHEEVTMLRKPVLFALVACSALALQAQTQRSATPPPHTLPRYRQIDQLAVRSRSGDKPSTLLLTHMLF